MRPLTDAIAYLAPTLNGLLTPVFLSLASTLAEIPRRGIVSTIYYILKQLKANSRLEIRGSGFENGSRLFLKGHNLS